MNLLPKVRSLMSDGKGDRVIAETLEITRHEARKLIREVELTDKGTAAGPVEIPVAQCKASPTARPIKPGHVLVLVESIKEIGLRQPINVRKLGDGYEIRGGGHRHAAFVMLERETIPAIVTNDDDLRAELSEIDENLIRNEYSSAEREIAITRRKAIYEELHPETKVGATGKGRSKVRQVGEANAPAERFTKATADATGLAERTIQRSVSRVESIGAETLQRVIGTALDKGEEIEALAKLSPERREEVIAKAEAGEKVSAKVAAKQERREEREEELADKQRALPETKFGVILADPEWRFEVYSRESGMDRAADNHYPTSATDVIASRPVQDIAADDCVLFLWATVPMLPDALRVMEAWGFAYKSHFIWNKDKIGTGYWNRNKHELLLVGTRGNVPAPAMGEQAHSVIDAPVRLHSEKPASFYLLIENYFPNLPKIELNARRRREGWEPWGLEAPEAAA